MKNNIRSLTTLLIILFATLSIANAAKRLLLPPPDGYKGVEISGTKYVVGQVYVPQFADTNELKQFGFRGFDAVGSTVYYKKVKAIWPLDTDLKTLPDLIVGLTYEKARNVNEMEQAYSSDAPKYNSCETIGVQYMNYNYGTMYNGNVTYNNYGGGGGAYCRSRSSYNCVTPLSNYNDYGYRYKTNSPTLLTPSRIGSTPKNRFVRYNSYCR